MAKKRDTKKRLVFFFKNQEYNKSITYSITTDKQRGHTYTIHFDNEGDLIKENSPRYEDIVRWVKSSLHAAFTNFKLKVEDTEGFKLIFNLENSYTAEVVLCKNGDFEKGGSQLNVAYTTEEVIFLSRIIWDIGKLSVS